MTPYSNNAYSKGVKENMFVDLKGVIGNGEFEDEIALEDYIRKLADREHRESFNSSVRRMNKDREVSYLDYGEDTPALDQHRKAQINEAISNFLVGLNHTKEIQLKELIFMENIGMTREVAAQLDIEMRLRLEEIFPQLKDSIILCFKKKANTCRRALIFPQEYRYSKFMDTMVTFLTHYNTKFVEGLNSRMRVSFKGKYILQIQEDIFRNFKEKITKSIQDYGLSSSVRPLIKRRELVIYGSYEKVNDMKKCVKGIMSYLYPKSYSFSKELAKHDLYSLQTRPGQDEIDRLNNKYGNRAFGWFDLKESRFYIRGDSNWKTEYISLLEGFMRNFDTKVRQEEYFLKYPKMYFKRIQEAKGQAGRYDIMVKFNDEKKCLNLIWNEYEGSHPRTKQPKREDLDKVKEAFGILFKEHDEDYQSFLDSSIPRTEESKRERGDKSKRSSQQTSAGYAKRALRRGIG